MKGRNLCRLILSFIMCWRAALRILEKNCSVYQNDGDLTPEEIVLSTTNACCVGVCLKKAFIKGGRYHIGFGFLSIVD